MGRLLAAQRGCERSDGCLICAGYLSSLMCAEDILEEEEG